MPESPGRLGFKLTHSAQRLKLRDRVHWVKWSIINKFKEQVGKNGHKKGDSTFSLEMLSHL